MAAAGSNGAGREGEIPVYYLKITALCRDLSMLEGHDGMAGAACAQEGHWTARECGREAGISPTTSAVPECECVYDASGTLRGVTLCAWRRNIRSVHRRTRHRPNSRSYQE